MGNRFMGRAAADQGIEPIDGRRARSEKTRGLIVEALMKLIAEGDLQPTSEAVAQRAAVGHRTVFRHFQDMDALYREIDTRLDVRVFAAVAPIAPSGSLKSRIDKIVETRARIFEQVKMFKRATVIRQWSSAFLRSKRARNARLLRGRLFHAIPELEGKSAEAQHALESLLSFESWEHLRVDQKCSVAKAIDALKFGALRLLS